MEKRDVTLVAETGSRGTLAGQMRLTMKMVGLVDDEDGTKEKAAQEALERVLTIAYGWYAYILGSALASGEDYIRALLEVMKECAWLEQQCSALNKEAKGEEEKKK